jgi:hypothetical protein
VGVGEQQPITGADLSPDGMSILIESYGGIYEVSLPSGNVRDLVQRQVIAARRQLPATHVPGQEAVAYDMHMKRIWHVAKSKNPQIYHMDCQDGGSGSYRRMLAPNALALGTPQPASPNAAPSDPCDQKATECYMVCNQKYIDCVAAPASCTRLYAARPTRPGAGWRGL